MEVTLEGRGTLDRTIFPLVFRYFSSILISFFVLLLSIGKDGWMDGWMDGCNEENKHSFQGYSYLVT